MSKERAFPSVAIDDRCGGMTLWDWYAGQALALGFKHAEQWHAMHDAEFKHRAAAFAYEYTDAMMAQRAKRIVT